MDITIIGAGVAGLSAAWWLSGQPGVRVTVLEQFNFAHTRGSSHGSSRISRTTYIDSSYVEMMQFALANSWPRLESDLGIQLLWPAAGCFFGPSDGLIQRYADAVMSAGFVTCQALEAPGEGSFVMGPGRPAGCLRWAVFARQAGIDQASGAASQTWA